MYIVKRFLALVTLSAVMAASNAAALVPPDEKNPPDCGDCHQCRRTALYACDYYDEEQRKKCDTCGRDGSPKECAEQKKKCHEQRAQDHDFCVEDAEAAFDCCVDPKNCGGRE